MRFELLPVDLVKPLPSLSGSGTYLDDNPNIMDEQYMDMLVSNIKKYGLNAVDPIRVISSNDVYYIVDGNHRYLAVKKVGLDRIPAVIIDVSLEDAYFMSIRHNMIKGSYDHVKLAKVIKNLHLRYGFTITEFLDKLNISFQKFKKYRKIAEIDDRILSILEGKGLSLTLLASFADIISEIRSKYTEEEEKIIMDEIFNQVLEVGLTNDVLNSIRYKYLTKNNLVEETELDLTNIDITSYRPVSSDIQEEIVIDAEDDGKKEYSETITISTLPKIGDKIQADELHDKEIEYVINCRICDKPIAKIRHIVHGTEVDHNIELL